MKGDQPQRPVVTLLPSRSETVLPNLLWCSVRRRRCRHTDSLRTHPPWHLRSWREPRRPSLRRLWKKRWRTVSVRVLEEESTTVLLSTDTDGTGVRTRAASACPFVEVENVLPL